MEVRRPAVAGAFYEGGAMALRDQIERSFLSKLGPGMPPKEAGSDERILGLVVPHAGYVYSGPVAAWSYSTLYQDRKPESFVMLGPNHTGRGSAVSIYHKGMWETPLGTVPIDEELAATIVRNTGIIDADTGAHVQEHSIEVQLPFLQYLYGEIRFVPIAMMFQDLETSLEVGEDIFKAVHDTGRKAVVVASTDFSHYVPQEIARENDHAAIDRIVAMDAPGLYNIVEKRRISMCGCGPVMTAIKVASALGAKKGRLLKYATSGDVMPMGDVVGYGALSLEKA